MTRFVVLVNLTEKGIAAARESASRAKAFRASAEKMGAKVESVFWTVGPYDGLFVLSAPDDETAAALVLGLGRTGSVRTCMLRAFDEHEFDKVVGKMA